MIISPITPNIKDVKGPPMMPINVIPMGMINMGIASLGQINALMIAMVIISNTLIMYITIGFFFMKLIGGSRI